MPRRHISIAAVVTGTDEDQRRHLPGIAICRLGKRGARALHQRLDACACIDRTLLGGDHFGSSQDRSHEGALAQEACQPPPFARNRHFRLVASLFAVE